MTPLSRALALCVLPLVAVACDSRDYEAEIAALESQLESARAENERLSTEVEQVRAQYQESGSVPGSLEDVQDQLSTVVEKGTRDLARLAELQGALGPEDAGLADEVETVRQDLEEMMQSLQMVAQNLGIQLREAGVEEGREGAPAGGGQPQPAPPAGQNAPQ